MVTKRIPELICYIKKMIAKINQQFHKLQTIYQNSVKLFGKNFKEVKQNISGFYSKLNNKIKEYTERMERIFYYIRVCTETSDIVNNMIFSPVKVNNKGEIINPRSAVDRLMLFYAIWLTKSAYFAI